MHGRQQLAAIGIGLAAAALAAVGAIGASPPAPPADLQFVFTSDAHYGITRAAFRGRSAVDAHVVNAALVAAINRLPETAFASDGGLRAGERIGPIDFVVESGDVANREETEAGGTIQPAAVSWSQFKADYINGLTVADAAGRRARLFVVPGNHDVSDAIGFYRPMTPPTDSTAMVEIYNRLMAPLTPLTTATYRSDRDRVFASRDIDGVHFVFITVWPDSRTRAWMEQNLARVSASTPVVIFTHDQPDAQAKHFRNPNGAHDINPRDQFENLLSDTLADGTTRETPPVIEEQGARGVLAPPSERHRLLPREFELEPVLRLDGAGPHRGGAHVPCRLADEGARLVEGRNEAVLPGGHARPGVSHDDRP